jgi:hypothetical protein
MTHHTDYVQRYFPFSSAVFSMIMGTHALGDDVIIEVDVPRYQHELELKQAILRDNDEYYVQSLPGTESMQWETVELLLPELARCYPAHFALHTAGDDWLWRNMLLDQTWRFRFGDQASLPQPPLDWLGRQVQEDLLLMSGDVAAGMPLVAGQLCFGNAWCLNDKVGKSFLRIHDEVPLFAETIGRSSNLLMERLKAGRPVWRINWSIKATDAMNLAPPINDALASLQEYVTAENAGERCFLRLERQVLLRLPRTGGILFSIHTYLAPMARIAAHAEQAQRLHGVLRTAPASLLDYKGIAPFAQPLIGYLHARSTADSQNIQLYHSYW